MALLSPSSLSVDSPSAWCSSIGLSSPSAGPRPADLQNECSCLLSHLLCFLEDLEELGTRMLWAYFIPFYK